MKAVHIAVHPHNAYGLYDRDRRFADRRDLRLTDTTLDHIMLVHKPEPDTPMMPDIEAARVKINLEDQYWRGRVFFTHSGHFASEYGLESALDFSSLSKIILDRFPADQYLFWGAEYHRPPKNLEDREKALKDMWRRRNHEPYGCVLFYHGILDLPSKSIDESHCLFYDW